MPFQTSTRPTSAPTKGPAAGNDFASQFDYEVPHPRTQSRKIPSASAIPYRSTLKKLQARLGWQSPQPHRRLGAPAGPWRGDRRHPHQRHGIRSERGLFHLQLPRPPPPGYDRVFYLPQWDKGALHQPSPPIFDLSKTAPIGEQPGEAMPGPRQTRPGCDRAAGQRIWHRPRALREGWAGYWLSRLLWHGRGEPPGSTPRRTCSRRSFVMLSPLRPAAAVEKLAARRRIRPGPLRAIASRRAFPERVARPLPPDN